MNWLKMLPAVLNTLLYSDCIAKLYYAASAREKKKGSATRLKDMYLNVAQSLIERNATDDLLPYLSMASKSFAQITEKRDVPKVGIVGEIFLKFNPFAQKSLSEWLVNRQIEVVPPLLTEFFLQGFVNQIVNQDSKLSKRTIPNSFVRWLYKRVWARMEKFNQAGSSYPYFTPFNDVFDEAKEAYKLGVDIISTTLSGYTKNTENTPDTPDFELLQKCAKELNCPIILEGKTKDYKDAKHAFELGAYAVVIGSMVTRPHKIIEEFKKGLL